MSTEVLKANAPGAMERALEVLRRGGVVAMPTDTVYGIGVDGFDAAAVEKLYIAKDRPANKAIMLLLGDEEDMAKAAASISSTARRLAERFWPGGLTLVVRGRAELPRNLCAENGTIGLRLPDSDVVRNLVRRFGRPLAVTSANLSGGVNSQTAEMVLADLDGRIDLILDGGATPTSVPSTVLDCTVEPPRVLREGAIGIGQIESELGLELAD
ncbi:MAG: threonylcarbamoyl-AMP synthase [Anaerolineae bacterium]|nr:threonylcarbamoyl-AMP synthase [Anaerolineae bacterium]